MIVFVVVMLCWFVFAGVFIFRKKPPAAPEKKRDKAATYGIALEGIGYAIVWTFRRPMFTPIVSSGILFEICIGLLTMGLAIGSVWMVLAAVRTLGSNGRLPRDS